jgi:hypothetical protein
MTFSGYRSNADAYTSLTSRDYPHGTRARYTAQKCRCNDCRRANREYARTITRDPRVSSIPVQKHIAALQAQGIGLRAISDATDIPRVALKRWQLGQPTIKRSLAEKILATDIAIIADHATVPADETRRLLRELVAEGYGKGQLAKLLGNQVPALQYKGDRVLAKTAMRVRNLHASLLAEGDDLPSEKPTTPREQILVALVWFDSITAEDLFDSMGLASGDRDAHMQALHRLWKSGEVERIGDSKPYRYRKAA